MIHLGRSGGVPHDPGSDQILQDTLSTRSVHRSDYRTYYHEIPEGKHMEHGHYSEVVNATLPPECLYRRSLGRFSLSLTLGLHLPSSKYLVGHWLIITIVIVI